MIVKRNNKFYVLSEKGKHLGGPYASREEADKRLREVEYFKHNKKETDSPAEFDKSTRAWIEDNDDKLKNTFVDADKEEFTKKGVNMTYSEIIDEHEKLVAALESDDPKKISEELTEQRGELEKYKKAALGKKEFLVSDNHYCFVRGLEIKEGEDKELYVDGLIATTHVDAVNDKIPKSTLDKWAKEINSGNPAANKVSYHHDRKPKVVGKALEGSAKVLLLPDKEYGLFTRTHVNKTADEYADLVYELQNGFIDGFSIEYNTHENSTTRKEYSDGKELRVLLPETELNGYGFASRAIQKEAMITAYSFKEIQRGDRMELEEKEKKKSEAGEEFMKADKKNSAEKEKKRDSEPDNDEDDKEYEDDENEDAMHKKVKKAKHSEKEYEDDEDEDAMHKKVAKPKHSEKESALVSEVKELVSRLDKMELKEKVIKNDLEVKEVPLEVKEFKEVLAGKITSVNEQIRRAANLVESKELLEKPTSRAETREYKSFSTNGVKLEYKSLGLTTNQNTDTDYLLSAAELQDVFDPIIYNLLNQKTVTWNLLEKDSYAGKGNNQVQFTGKVAANTTAAFYTGNAVNTGNVTRLKFQTKFKKLQVGISVDGDMIAAARGGPVSDVFAQEVMDSTIDMLSYLNAQLFGTVGLETASGIIGFEYIANSASYTSLYNLTRSTANRLAPDSATDTYINQNSTVVSMTNLRAAIRQAIKEGADKRNLVFITEHTQGNLLRSKFDSERRMLSAQDTDFGFKTDLFIDGVPVFEDKDCATTKWFLVDKETHRVAIWIPPTIEMLGKIGDSMDGFIKMYLATYNRAPRRLVEIYGCSTS